MRRSQFNQVLSHYYWILYEVLSGDETSTKTLAQSTEKYASLLRASLAHEPLEHITGSFGRPYRHD